MTLKEAQVAFLSSHSFRLEPPHTWREKGEPFNHLHAHGVRQSLSGEVPDQQAIITSFLLDENYSMKDRKVE